MDTFQLTPELRDRLMTFVCNPPTTLVGYNELVKCLREVKILCMPYQIRGAESNDTDVALINQVGNILNAYRDLINASPDVVEARVILGKIHPKLGKCP